MPVGFEAELYNEYKLQEDTTIEKITFWDYSGNGDWTMLGVIRTPGAVTAYKFDMAINAEDRTGAIVRDSDDSRTARMLSSTIITVFEAYGPFLVIGCPTCSNNDGWIRMYSPESLVLQKATVGGKGYTYVGKNVIYTSSDDGTNHYWYSSRNSKTMQINQL